MKQHIAIYCRVSTSKQRTKNQEPDLKQWIAAFADEVPVKWYRDEGFSAKSMDRPGWKALEQAINAGYVTKIVIWRLDRLGRRVRQLSKLFDELIERKIALVSIKDSFDLSTATGRLIAHIMSSVAQYEVELDGERVRAGQAIARANGRKWGGTKKGHRKITPAMIRVMRKLKAEHMPILAIARTMKLSRQTVYTCLAE